MRTIHRIQIPHPERPDGIFSMDLPKGAKVISAGELMGGATMFVEATAGRPEPRLFGLFEFSGRAGGDVQIPDGYEHVSTWQSVGGVFIWHLYERLT